MPAGTLWLSVAMGLFAAGLFAYVGYRLGHRVVTTPEARAAFTLFRVWWYAVAVITLLVPVRIVLYLAGALPPWVYDTTTTLALVLACVGLWALLCNLVYLYRGSARWWGALALFYVAVGTVFLGLLAWTGPTYFIGDDGWALQPGTPAREPPAAFSIISLMALLGPQLAAAVAYLGLIRFAPEPTQRYRIVMLSSSIIVWFGGTLVAAFLSLQGAPDTLVSRGISIVAALLALFAYDPPPFLQRRLGVHRAGEENPPPATPLSVSPPVPPAPPTPPQPPVSGAPP